jgi:hypothetical protein
MVGGVLIDWSVIFQAIDLVLEILDFAPGLIAALQVARAIAHSMGWQAHPTSLIQCVLELGLKVRQVGGGQVFDSHLRHPFWQAGDILDWHTPRIWQRVSGLGLIQMVFMPDPLCKAELACIRLKVFSIENIYGQPRSHKGMQLAQELLLRSLQSGWVLVAPSTQHKNERQ